MSQTCSAQLTFVLLCSGRGSDYQSYRPKLQESQWWMRRDALVRCTCASLYGSDDNLTNNEVILIYDEDLSIMRMTRTTENSQSRAQNIQPPTEENILMAWRKAAQMSEFAIVDASVTTCTTSITMRSCALEVECIRELWKKKLNEENTSNERLDVIESINYNYDREVEKMSKRALLEFLQKNCENDIEFLRKHHLNSSVNVALRKTNQSKLLKVYDEWKKIQTKGKAHDNTDKSKKLASKKSSLELTFRSILGNGNAESTRETVAVVLHEDCRFELECFGKSLSTSTNNGNNENTPKRIVVVLGAVRDMQNSEYRALDAACTALKIPLTGCHLGKTPEFTSKIITAMVNHHCTMNVLAPAVQTLRDKVYLREKSKGFMAYFFDKPKDDPEKNMGQSFVFSNSTTKLHTLCLVPIPTSSVTTDLSRRSHILWSMVRVCVCALWRSRLASNTTEDGESENITSSDNPSAPLENVLSFFFSDGVILTINQNTLVKSLASKHQAAPSEYQILNALCEMLDSQNQQRNRELKWDFVCEEFLDSTIDNNEKTTASFLYVIDFLDPSHGKQESESNKSILNVAYGAPCDCSTRLEPNSLSTGGRNDQKQKRIIFGLFHLGSTQQEKSSSSNSSHFHNDLVKAIRNAFEKFSIPSIKQCWYMNSIDSSAISITIIQHLHYHNRLVPALKSFTKEVKELRHLEEKGGIVKKHKLKTKRKRKKKESKKNSKKKLKR